MKKLVFTAIAVIAFSGIGMANTKEVKLVSSVTEEKELSPCAKVYLDTYQEFVDLELEGEAGAEAWAAYKDCLSGKY